MQSATAEEERSLVIVSRNLRLSSSTLNQRENRQQPPQVGTAASLARFRLVSARAAAVLGWGPAERLALQAGGKILRKFSLFASSPPQGWCTPWSSVRRVTARPHVPLINTVMTWCPEPLGCMVLVALISFRGVYSKFVCRALSPARFDSGSGFSRAGRVGVSERFSRSAHSEASGRFYFWRDSQ